MNLSMRIGETLRLEEVTSEVYHLGLDGLNATLAGVSAEGNFAVFAVDGDGPAAGCCVGHLVYTAGSYFRGGQVFYRRGGDVSPALSSKPSLNPCMAMQCIELSKGFTGVSPGVVEERLLECVRGVVSFAGLYLPDGFPEKATNIEGLTSALQEKVEDHFEVQKLRSRWDTLANQLPRLVGTIVSMFLSGYSVHGRGADQAAEIVTYGRLLNEMVMTNPELVSF